MTDASMVRTYVARAGQLLAALAAFCAMAMSPDIARAGLTRNDIASVSFAPPENARVPLDLVFRDQAGRRLSLGDALVGRPALLVPVDFTCRTVCGPSLTIATAALRETDLKAGADYRVLVVGIDPKDSAEDARSLTQDRMGRGAIGDTAAILQGDAGTIARLLHSIGYRAIYDAEHDQYAHPAGVAVLTADGRVTRVLSSLALNPQDLRLAMLEAGEGRTGSLVARLSALCYGYDSVHGVYTLAVNRILAMAGAVTVALLGLGLLFLHRATRNLNGEASR